MDGMTDFYQLVAIGHTRKKGSCLTTMVSREIFTTRKMAEGRKNLFRKLVTREDCLSNKDLKIKIVELRLMT